jgi:alpha-methylacyl-CoA racemase
MDGLCHWLSESTPYTTIEDVERLWWGGMILAFGITCGILEAQKFGRGQVIETSMLEGTILMMNLFFGFKAEEKWTDERGNNLLDGGTHFYRCYKTADGKWVAIASIEP